ncbi:MAG: RAMP superfamily CRISPR-associated protein [Bacteroidales bacterium]
MIRITLESIEPLHLATSHTVSPTASTLDFIPGTALRGALAQQYLDQHGTAEDKRFNNWFLADQVHFGPLNPLGKTTQPAVSSSVIPLTAFSCKLHEGFRAENPHHHGVRDILFEFLKGEKALPNDRCYQTECDAHLIPFGGFYSKSPLKKIKVYKRFENRTAIDANSETAAEKQLYSLEVLEEHQNFSGVIELGSSEEEAEFRKVMLTEQCQIRLGAARTRSLGLTEIVETRLEQRKTSLEPLTQRIEVFDKYAKSKMDLGEQDVCFALTLLSDCILQDAYFRYRGVISPEDLARYVHKELMAVKPLGTFCRTRQIDGWNAAQKNPRPTEISISAGSVFVFKTRMSADALAKSLMYIERDGIGERTQEGFGSVSINDSFHMLEGQR